MRHHKSRVKGGIDVNLRQMEYLLAIREAGTISRAAEKRLVALIKEFHRPVVEKLEQSGRAAE